MGLVITQSKIADKTLISKHVLRLLDSITSKSSALHQRDQNGISLESFRRDRKALIDALSSDLMSGHYRLGSAQRKIIRVDKWRMVYQFDLLDRVVMSVVAECVNEALSRFLSDNVHSFIRGRSNLNAIRRAAKFVHRHYNAAKSPQQREMIVWRLDIKNYTDSIPLGDGSELWKILQNFTRRYFENPDWVFTLMQDGLRPQVYDHVNFSKFLDMSGMSIKCLDGAASNIVGTTTGSAFSPIAANLYLSRFDDLLTVDNAFYARYGDDIIFINSAATADLDLIKRANSVITELGLQANAAKEKYILLTGRGRVPGGLDNKNYGVLTPVPMQSVEFLGWQFNHKGQYQPKSDKIMRDIRRFKRRVINTYQVFPGNETDVSRTQKTTTKDRLELVVNLASMLRQKNTRSDLNFICRKVSEKLSQRFQRALDLRVAGLLSTIGTGIKGPKSFRYISWAQLIEDLGLRNSQRFFRKYKSK